VSQGEIRDSIDPQAMLHPVQVVGQLGVLVAIALLAP
jgi:hypothetical protein